MIVFYNPADNDIKEVYHDWIPTDLVGDNITYHPVETVPVGTIYLYNDTMFRWSRPDYAFEGPDGSLYVYDDSQQLEMFRLLKAKDRCMKCGNWNKLCTCTPEEKKERLFKLLGGIEAESIDDDDIARWLNGDK